MTTITLRYPVEPKPAPRPRVMGRYTAMPDDYKAYLENLGWLMTAARNKAGIHAPVDRPIGIRVTFSRSTHRRVDWDNLAKVIGDAGNGIIWLDDSQIRHANVFVLLGRLEPFTDLEVNIL